MWKGYFLTPLRADRWRILAETRLGKFYGQAERPISTG